MICLTKLFFKYSLLMNKLVSHNKPIQAKGNEEYSLKGISETALKKQHEQHRITQNVAKWFQSIDWYKTYQNDFDISTDTKRINMTLVY